MRGHRGKQRGAEQARHHLADLHAFASRTYSSTFFASTSSGTLPPLTTMSLKSRRSYLAPSAFCASPRWRTISLCPTLYPHACPPPLHSRSPPLPPPRGLNP